jgi:hypothetical protein
MIARGVTSPTQPVLVFDPVVKTLKVSVTVTSQTYIIDSVLNRQITLSFNDVEFLSIFIT